MIATENTLFLAYNKDKSIVHQGYVLKGQALDIGLPNKEYFTTKNSFETRLKELSIENETDFEEWIEPPIDYTPPTLSNIGVIIPTYWEDFFEDDKFICKGFVVSLLRINTELVVDIAYLQWKSFQEELYKEHNKDLKRALRPIWLYVEQQIINGNTIEI